MIHASFLLGWAAWRAYGCQKRGLTGARVYRGILGRNPDFPPSDLSHTTFLSVTSHGMLLIPGG